MKKKKNVINEKKTCIGALEMNPQDRIDGWLSFLFLAGISVQLLICVQIVKYECFMRTNLFSFFGRYQFMLLKFVIE